MERNESKGKKREERDTEKKTESTSERRVQAERETEESKRNNECVKEQKVRNVAWNGRMKKIKAIHVFGKYSKKLQEQQTYNMK